MVVGSSPSPLVLSSFLLLSLPLLFFLGPRVLAPKTLPSIPAPDEIDDLALFRRATLSTATTVVSPPSPAKIAFMFLTNSDLAFSPLWEKFFSKNHDFFNVYVHADPQSVLKLPPTPSFRFRFIPSKATQRSSSTLISAARRLLAAAILDDPANSFFALLSQTCIPLHSFQFVYKNVILASPKRPKSFIEVIADDPGLFGRYVARGDTVMLPEVPFDRFRVGSQFFILARRHALMVVRDRRLWRKFKLPCLVKRKHSCYPEEHYFPTLLSMLDPEGVTGYTLTRVNWTESVDGHPHTYGPAEVSPELIRELRRSNGTYSYLFGRKFSPECLNPLMKIADSVIFKD